MSLTVISDIRARQVLDSRGNPTVEVDVELTGGAVGRAIVPSGASTGEHEAWELRDGDKEHYLGKGVSRAVQNVETEIADAVVGFAPNLNSVEDALDTIAKAVDKAGYKLGDDIAFALDVASSEFYDSHRGVYVFKKSDKSERSADDLIAFYQNLCSKYPIISIEDGCAENDWKGWKKLTDALGQKVQLVGDDLFVTNVEFLQKGIEQGVGNSILVKVNQIGSLTETLDAIELAKENSYTAVISHRSGETEDTTIAAIAEAH